MKVWQTHALYGRGVSCESSSQRSSAVLVVVKERNVLQLSREQREQYKGMWHQI